MQGIQMQGAATGEVPPEMKNVGQYLRHKADLKLRVGVLDGKRVDYFKGRAAIKALLSPQYAKLKVVPTITTEDEAIKLLHSLIQYQFYLKIQRGDHLPPPSNPSMPSASAPTSQTKQPRNVRIEPQQSFQSDSYYVFLLPPSQTKIILGAIGMVAVILAGVMFPLWPHSLRLGTWYLSMAVLGLIGLFIVIAIVRLIVWGVTKLAGPAPGIWIYPNLFEDVGFFDSFRPGWAWDVPPKKKGKKKRSKENGAVEGEGAEGEVSNKPKTRQRQTAKIEEIED